MPLCVSGSGWLGAQAARGPPSRTWEARASRPASAGGVSRVRERTAPRAAGSSFQAVAASGSQTVVGLGGTAYL